MGILQEYSLGLLETCGYTAALEGADALSKAGDVELLFVRRVGGARICVLFMGALGACDAALEAGARAAQQHGELTGARIIARPLEDLDRLIEAFRSNVKLADAIEEATKSPASGPVAAPVAAPVSVPEKKAPRRAKKARATQEESLTEPNSESANAEPALSDTQNPDEHDA